MYINRVSKDTLFLVAKYTAKGYSESFLVAKHTTKGYSESFLVAKHTTKRSGGPFLVMASSQSLSLHSGL